MNYQYQLHNRKKVLKIFQQTTKISDNALKLKKMVKYVRKKPRK